MSRFGNVGGRLYRGEVSVNFVGRKRTWYSISAAILRISQPYRAYHGSSLALSTGQRGPRYHGVMTMAPHAAEVHQLVDRLKAGQIEALYVLLLGMLPERAGSAQAPADADPAESWSPSSDAPAVRRLSISGIARGDHDLSARSQEILRRELGHQAEGSSATRALCSLCSMRQTTHTQRATLFSLRIRDA